MSFAQLKNSNPLAVNQSCELAIINLLIALYVG
jgi:hypothetical protein